jgi:phosphate transport system permease protein
MNVSSDSARRNRIADITYRSIVIGAGTLVLILMAGILISLLSNSWFAILQSGPGFLTGTSWNPVNGVYGALPSILGTLLSTAIAMVLAIPLSLVIALFLVELAPPFISKPVGQAIELLAAVPSIIYGMWGLFVFAPFMADHIQPFIGKHLGFMPLFQGAPMGIGVMTAGVILALMVLPFITAVMRDVFTMVPSVVKEAAYGMGSTTLEVSSKVTVKYGFSGLVGAVFLGLGRAVGETMAVTFVIGNSHRLSSSLFAPGTTIASTLANEFNEADDPYWLGALIELGLVLFLMTVGIQILAQLWIARARRKAGGGL